MRTHRKHSQFVIWSDDALLRDVARLPHLAFARIEPVVRGLRGGALMDLVFCSPDRVAVIPCIEIDPEMLLQRECSPFVWPHESAMTLPNGAIEEFERVLLPWIESLTFGRQMNEQVSRSFGDRDAAAIVSAAAEAGFLGVTSYGRVLQEVAPYLYAVRFSENQRVAIADPQGAFGAAILGAHAREVSADFGSEERRSLAERWYARRFARLSPGDAFDLGIAHTAAAIEANVRIVLDAQAQQGETQVEVATPVPTDIMLSYDPQDAPVCRRFVVQRSTAREMRPAFVPARPQPAGGSSGRVLFVLREDYLRAPDSDTDEAGALASLLRAEGFTVDLAAASRAVPSQYDLVHAFTLPRANELLPALQAARACGIPVVVSPLLDDICAQGVWGTGIVRALLRVSTDETDLEDNLDLVAQRRLDAPGLTSKRQEPFDGYEAALRQALAIAGAALCASADEEALLRGFGFGRDVISTGPCLIAAAAGPAPFEGDFVLAHAPVEARSNLLLLVRAAVSARLPLVVAGPITDPEYAIAVKAQAGERVVFAGEPDEPAAEALYRRATIFADVAWIRFGTHRLFRAAASGAALVISGAPHVREMLGNDGVWEADPASQASIALALRDAWIHARGGGGVISATARKAGELADPRASLLATARAYAAAQGARAPA